MTEQEKIKKAIRHFECMRDDAKAVLDTGFGTHEGESSIVYDNRKMYAELAISALEKQINGGWIPCSERLPEEATNVLVTQDFGEHQNVTEASYIDNLHGIKFWCCYDHKIDNVVAWQPLPEPYLESEAL